MKNSQVLEIMRGPRTGSCRDLCSSHPGCCECKDEAAEMGGGVPVGTSNLRLGNQDAESRRDLHRLKSVCLSGASGVSYSVPSAQCRPL